MELSGSQGIQVEPPTPLAPGQNAIWFWKTGDGYPRSPVENIGPVSGLRKACQGGLPGSGIWSSVPIPPVADIVLRCVRRRTVVRIRGRVRPEIPSVGTIFSILGVLSLHQLFRSRPSPVHPEGAHNMWMGGFLGCVCA